LEVRQHDRKKKGFLTKKLIDKETDRRRKIQKKRQIVKKTKERRKRWKK
jgi:hypothetical protein